MKKHTMLAVLTTVLLLVGCTPAQTSPTVDASAFVEQTPAVSVVHIEEPAPSIPPEQGAAHKQRTPESATFAQADNGEGTDADGQIKVHWS